MSRTKPPAIPRAGRFVMRVSRVLVACAAVAFSLLSSRPAHADESYQLCLQLDAGVANQYFLNFGLGIGGKAVFVGGMKGHGGQDDHGPVTGSLSRTPLPSYGYEMGLMVTFSNGGDYTGPNVENIVFTFNPDGTIAYKRWFDRETTFTQGTAFAIACPQ
jgi:hypothetical protein